MSQFYPIPVVGLVGLPTALILSRATTLPDQVAGGVAVAAGLAAGIAWLASPLPNGSGYGAVGGGGNE